MTPPVQVLAVGLDRSFVDELRSPLDSEKPSASLTRVETIEAGLERLDDAVDCVLGADDLPDGSGIDLVKRIRDEGNDLPIVLRSEPSSEERARRAIEAGATDWIPAGSVPPIVLARRIATAIECSHVDPGREERERDLEMHERLVEESTDAIVVMAADGTVTYVTPSSRFVVGYESEELIGENAFEYVHPEDRERTVERFYETIEHPDRAPTVEFRFRQVDGSWTALEARGRNLLDDPVVDGIVAYARDVTERKGFERTLAALHEASRDLLGATSKAEVYDLVLETAVDVLDLPGVGLYHFDDGVLRPAAASEYVAELFDGLPTFGDGDESITWRTYADGEPTVIDDVRDHDRTYRDDTPLRSGVWIPLGDHGVIAFVSEQTAAFDRDARQLADLLAATTEAALDRVERERDLRRRETQLEELTELSRRLIAAEDRDEVCEAAVAAAETALDLPVAAVARYDDTEGVLRTRAHTADAERLDEDEGLLGESKGIAWESFVGRERTAVADRSAQCDGDPTYRSAIVLPLGVHGVLVAASPEPDAVDDTVSDIASILAASAQTALERTERERLLGERERTLEEQNRQLERLRRVNEVIRKIDQALVEATNREEIERAVCDRLANAKPYLFAWIGEESPETGELRPRAWAGDEDGYLDAVTITTDEQPTEQGSAGKAARTREVHTVGDAVRAPSNEPWRDELLERGYRSVASIPLVYAGTLYGVLSVYADRPGVFDDLERDVLGELGETIAYAVNAVETRRSLLTDEIVELDVRLDDPDDTLSRLAHELQCRLDVEDVRPRAGGSVEAFVTVTDANATEIGESADGLVGIEGLSIVAETDDRTRFEATLSDPTITTTLAECGAKVRSVTVEAGESRVVVELPSTADVRSFVGALQERYPGAQLVARRDRDRSERAGPERRAGVESRLTDKQRDALKTAYFGGYFEWPRDRNAAEIASSLDVSRPTFNRHARAGQRVLLEWLFEDRGS